LLALYADALSLLEQSALGHASRHSAWLFTVANVLHVLGAAFVVGGIGVFDLKVLRDRGRGAAAVGRIAVPLAAFGLAVQVPTGLVLLSVEATKLGVNPAFYAKLAFIAVGLANLLVLHRRFRTAMAVEDLPRGATAFAAVSFAAWVLTLIAGRMMAYV
jgi:putative copper export protein